MRTTHLLVPVVSACLTIAVGVIGCDRGFTGAGSASAAGTTPSSDQLPAGLFLAEAPSGAKDIGAVKRAPDAASEVVVRGRIGGRVDPFVKGRAMFMLADRSVPTCAEKHGHGCPTPWDYCCEPKERVLANTATIQVVGSDGRPLKADLRGRNGLEPTAHVVVAGRVSKRDDGVLVVDAGGIYVKKN